MWREILLQQHKLSWSNNSSFLDQALLREVRTRTQGTSTWLCFSQVTGVSCNLCFPGHSDSALAAVGFQDSTLKSYNIWGSSAQHRLSLVGSYFLSISIHHDVFSHLLSLQEKQMCTSGPGLSAAQLSWFTSVLLCKPCLFVPWSTRS